MTTQDDAQAWLREFDQRAGQLARRLVGDPEAVRLATHARAHATEADTLRRVVNGEPVAAIAASRRTSASIVRRQLRNAIDRVRRLATHGLLTAADRHALATLGDTEHGAVTRNDAATLAGYGFEGGYTLIGYHDRNVSRRKDRALRKVQLLHEVRRRQASPELLAWLRETDRGDRLGWPPFDPETPPQKRNHEMHTINREVDRDDAVSRR